LKLTSYLKQAFRPSLADVIPITIAGQILVMAQLLPGLLNDGDTGWHIRTGDWILQNRAVPRADLFSFSRPGDPWFAWEWLSDVLMALVHQHWGLGGVAAAGWLVILLTLVIVFRHMIWRGANFVVALAVLQSVIGATSVHHLARPHLFTLLLITVSLWMLDRDRRRPDRRIWLLLPLSVLWVNLHGGFFALPATLAALAGGLAMEAWLAAEERKLNWSLARRYGILGAGCLAASLINPYGFQLHVHVARYLTSDFIRNTIQEFLAPDFRSEGMLRFEMLLFVSLLLGGWMLSRRRAAEACLLLLWGHMALGSARHVPIFALLAGPIVAAELTLLFEQWALRSGARSPLRILSQMDADLGPSFRRSSAWGALVVAAALFFFPESRWPRDFNDSRFPVALVRAEASRLLNARVYTSDQWGDYLIYRGWPRQRVFFDGRSDFYGRALGEDYLKLMNGRRQWKELFRKYGFDAALVPADWPLVPLLEQDPEWRLVREDRVGVLYERVQ